MALAWVQAVLYVGVHPLESVHRCYDALFNTGSGVMRSTAEVLSFVSHSSLSMAAIAPTLLDALHTPQAEELCNAVVGSVKAAHSVLLSDHLPPLLHHSLGLLRSPASRDLLDALSSSLLTFIRLCRTEEMRKTSGQLVQALAALHAQLAVPPRPPPASSSSWSSASSPSTGEDPCHSAWVDCLLFLSSLAATPRLNLCPEEMSAAVSLIRAKDARLKAWWQSRDGGAGGGGRAHRSVSEVEVEGRGYRLDGEWMEEEREEKADSVAEESWIERLRDVLK